MHDGGLDAPEKHKSKEPERKDLLNHYILFNFFQIIKYNDRVWQSALDWHTLFDPWALPQRTALFYKTMQKSRWEDRCSVWRTTGNNYRSFKRARNIRHRKWSSCSGNFVWAGSKRVSREIRIGPSRSVRTTFSCFESHQYGTPSSKGGLV